MIIERGAPNKRPPCHHTNKNGHAKSREAQSNLRFRGV